MICLMFIRNPVATNLAAVLEEVMQINERMQPHVERYHQLMRDDPDFGSSPVSNIFISTQLKPNSRA